MKLIDAKKPPAEVMWTIGDKTPVGKLLIGATDKGAICRIAFLRKRRAADVLAEWQIEWPHTVFTRGKAAPDMTTAPVVLTGSVFQQTVWKAMAKIPFGKVLSYGEVAAKIGKPGAARAVGAACGANPVPYVVPCHRVIAAGGRLGGFSGGEGIVLKAELLLAEGWGE